MRLHHYLRVNGVDTTEAAVAQAMGQLIRTIYGGMMTPNEVLLDGWELRRFCDATRDHWRSNAPDEMIVRALRTSVNRRY